MSSAAKKYSKECIFLSFKITSVTFYFTLVKSLEVYEMRIDL